ncbi:MAG: WD40 repeat domain-containing protein [Cyclobacteriaceae bacterium]|nr:WD40 repeat domain-containing protein [Cyclobacteriaceae bacterium]UYN86359.1 MAG: WD40 repeat domain-containing protein [Cyclobacteriaceae bacterium]
MSKVDVKRLHNITGHRDSVYTLQQADRHNLFFSGSGDGMVVLWNLEHPDEGELIAKLPHSVYALHVHRPTGLLVAGHNYDGIHVIDWKNKQAGGSLKMTKAAIFDIQSMGNRIFVADGAGSLTELDLQNLAISNTQKHSDKSARTIAINPASAELAVGYSDCSIRIFNLVDLSLKQQWVAHTNSVFTLRYTPDGNFLMSGSRDARLKLWDVHAGYLPATEVVAHMYAINHIDFSPDSKHFVTCSMDKSIKVWDLQELRLLKVIDKGRHAGHGTSVNKLLWTHHHGQLVSASDDRTMSVWSIEFNSQSLDT